MMAARKTGLIDRMPAVRGALQAAIPLHRYSWFRVGGPAEILFEPADAEDLAVFLAALPEDIPVTVLGVCSNLLIRDGGIDGVVVRLGRAFTDIVADGTELRVGAGALDISVARAAARADVAGLEFLCGIPGTIGGAVRMNAGAYGHDMAEILGIARLVDRCGRVQELATADFGFSYRHAAIDEGAIVLSATLIGRAGNRDTIEARMAEIRAEREDTQPVRARTGGSTFVNPPGEKAWRLIDGAGCRGLTRGGARVSEKHCNFLVNTGNATAADLEALGEEVRRRVHDATGITLDWEIRRIGRHGGAAACEVKS